MFLAGDRDVSCSPCCIYLPLLLTLWLSTSVLYIVLGKQVLDGSHGLELEVVPGGIFEEHGPLFPRLALESKMRLNNELDPGISYALGQRMELLLGQRQPNMRHGNLISVHGIEVIDASIVIPYPMRHDLVPVESIILPLFGRAALLATEDVSIKFFCQCKIVDGERIVKGAAWRRLGEGYKLSFDDEADALLVLSVAIPRRDMVARECKFGTEDAARL